jgi:hypothetical protein
MSTDVTSKPASIATRENCPKPQPQSMMRLPLRKAGI